MSIERYDLAPTKDGKEQWADIERRPTRLQMKKIEVGQRRALRGDQALDAEDVLMAVLVSDWVVYTADGKTVPIPAQGTKALDEVPGDVMAPLIDELSGVIASINRGNAMSQIASTLTNMSWTLSDDDAARLRDLISDIQGLFGVTPPNQQVPAGT